jgi:hypothetical protein
MTELREPISIAFKLSESETRDLTWYRLNDLADVIVARDFEKLDTYYPWTDHQMSLIRECGKWYGLGRLSSDASDIWMTAVLSRPLGHIDAILTQSSTALKKLKSNKSSGISLHHIK